MGIDFGSLHIDVTKLCETEPGIGMLSPSVAFFSRYLVAHRVFLIVVLQKSIPTQIRQLVLYLSNSEKYVDGFVGKLTSAKRL